MKSGVSGTCWLVGRVWSGVHTRALVFVKSDFTFKENICVLFAE